jgi:hypothetical protein
MWSIGESPLSGMQSAWQPRAATSSSKPSNVLVFLRVRLATCRSARTHDAPLTALHLRDRAGLVRLAGELAGELPAEQYRLYGPRRLRQL